jgi:hypothetical protein
MPDGIVAKAMVEMPMSTEQVTGLEMVIPNIADNGLAFIFKIGTAIDDHGFRSLITYDEAVFLQHIAYEGTDVEHILYDCLEWNIYDMLTLEPLFAEPTVYVIDFNTVSIGLRLSLNVTAFQADKTVG